MRIQYLFSAHVAACPTRRHLTLPLGRAMTKPPLDGSGILLGINGNINIKRKQLKVMQHATEHDTDALQALLGEEHSTLNNVERQRQGAVRRLSDAYTAQRQQELGTDDTSRECR